MDHFTFYVKLSQLVIYPGKKSKLFMHSFLCIVEKASLARTIWRTEVVMIYHHSTFYDFDSGNACMRVLTLEYTDITPNYIHYTQNTLLILLKLAQTWYDLFHLLLFCSVSRSGANLKQRSWRWIASHAQDCSCTWLDAFLYVSCMLCAYITYIKF